MKNVNIIICLFCIYFGKQITSLFLFAAEQFITHGKILSFLQKGLAIAAEKGYNMN